MDKILIITKHVSLRYENEQIIIEGEENKKIPLYQIGTVIINSLMVSFTAFLLNQLHKNKIKIIFCDEKFNPYSEIVNYSDNYNSPVRLKNQISWNKKIKDSVWKRIVECKISVQMELIKKQKLKGAKMLQEYINSVEEGDKSNREGIAASVYFNSLFGLKFNRKQDNNINSGLNYGYAILLSQVNRTVSSLGYNLSLGIKHASASNLFNFSCDIMEVFRPFVDKIVFENRNNEFNREYKKLLINVLNEQVKYKKKKLILTDAIYEFLLDIVSALEGKNEQRICAIDIL